jgi:hypothetical protein
VAQILIGVLVPLSVIMAGILGYKFWWKRRHIADDAEISMSRFRRIEDFENLENFENIDADGQNPVPENTVDGN